METLSVSLIATRDWAKETIDRIDLQFITDDGEVPTFDPADDIETNAIKFVDHLTPYSLVIVTDLFTRAAAPKDI